MFPLFGRQLALHAAGLLGRKILGLPPPQAHRSVPAGRGDQAPVGAEGGVGHVRRRQRPARDLRAVHQVPQAHMVGVTDRGQVRLVGTEDAMPHLAVAAQRGAKLRTFEHLDHLRLLAGDLPAPLRAARLHAAGRLVRVEQRACMHRTLHRRAAGGSRTRPPPGSAAGRSAAPRCGRDPRARPPRAAACRDLRPPAAPLA